MRDHAEDIAVEHILRPTPPWRPRSLLTECGLPVANHPVITREQWKAKVKEQGQRRAAMSTCMTCGDTATRHPSWEEDVVRCIGREVEWSHRWGRKRETGRFREELIAIAILIERHRAEFDELLEDQAAIVSLAAQRGKAQ